MIKAKKAKKAEESAAALENQVNRDNELARQQEKQLLEDTRRQVEKNRVCAAGDSQAAANVLRQSAAERERQLRAIMHEEVSTQVVRQVAEETGKPAGAMVLPDGRVVTGKTSSLLGASASLLLNALKAQGGVSDKLDLISAQVIEPISKLKIESLGHHNPRLHSDEVLIALCISALTNPIAQLAQEQLGSLRGCDAHFSVIISEEDVKLYKRLGIHVTCEPRYEVKKLYHK